MSDSKLHLMSFAPVPDTKTTVHVVGLPDSLRDALFTLMPPRKEGGYLKHQSPQGRPALLARPGRRAEPRTPQRAYRQLAYRPRPH